MSDTPPSPAARRHDRLRLHGRRAFPGLARGAALLRSPAHPSMDVVVGRDASAVAAAAEKWGWGESATDWREVIARDDIDIVDIVTPGDTHAEIAIAALEAGKHVLCEKPLANTVAEAEAMADAAARAAEKGVRVDGGLHLPPGPRRHLARDLVAAGRIGDVRQVRASYRQDWLMDAEAPLTWRMQKDRAGSGALGDIGAHAVDLAEYITGSRLEGLRRHRHDRQGAPAARRGPRALGHGLRRDAARSRSTTSPSSTAGSRTPPAGSRPRLLRGDPLRHGPQERPAHRGLRIARRDLVRPRAAQRAAVLRRHAARHRAGLPHDPCHRARPPLRRAVVAGRPHARLRARLLAPGRRLRRGDRRRRAAAPVVRRRPARAARARRGRAELARGQRLDRDHPTAPAGRDRHPLSSRQRNATTHRC